jgi:hypothetical protein
MAPPLLTRVNFDKQIYLDWREEEEDDEDFPDPSQLQEIEASMINGSLGYTSKNVRVSASNGLLR